MNRTVNRNIILGALAAGLFLAVMAVRQAGTHPNPNGSESDINWLTALEPALAEAQQTQRPIMIDFFATWCPPCKLLDAETYSDPTVEAKSRDWVMVRIDVDKNKALARQYGISSIPTIVLLQPDGKEAARQSGFMEPKRMLAFMDQVRSE